MIEGLHAPAATAALVAAAASLFLVPTAMWIAGWSGFVAIPRVGRPRTIPYLGGPAVALAVLAGSQLVHGASSSASSRVALALLLATVLGVVGLLDDHRPLSPLVRLVLEIGAAGVLIAVTRPLPLTGTTTIDAALTIVWIVVVVNGVNFLDNCDALATIIVGLAAVGLAVGAGTHTPAGVCAAAIAGACAAFSAFNLRPAAVYLGDAGSMFLGFLLPALALELVHGSSQPVRATWCVIPLLALPALEMVITSLRRVVHGRPCWLSAPDNLTYSLARRGFGTNGAFLVQTFAQFLLLAVAVAVFDGRVSAPVAAAVVAAELAGFAVVTRGADVHGSAVRWTRRARVVGFVVVFGVAGLLAAGAVTVVRAYRDASDGASTLDLATRRLRAGDTAGASVEFARADKELTRAGDLLGPVAVVARVIPGVGQNVNAAQVVVDSGRDLARDGRRLAGAVDVHAMRLRNAAVPVAVVEAAQTPLATFAHSVAQADRRVAAIDEAMLLGPVARKVDAARTLLDGAAVDTENAADLARVAPAVLGAAGERRYLVIVQNPAEARATGGIPASVGVLDARDGRLDLGDMQPVEELDAAAQLVHTATPAATTEYAARYGRFRPQLWWENMTMSPDFPTVASVMAAQYQRQTQQHVDGVLSIDPSVLGAILRLSGPVHVDGWQGAITAGNVGDVVLRGEYAQFSSTVARKAFLGRVTAAAWKALQRTDLGDPLRVARTLGPTAAGRHLLLWLAHPQEQRVMRDIRLDGGVPDPTGDALFSTVQNAAGTKLDLYMSRRLSYQLMIVPVDADHANVWGTASLSIGNGAPAGLPAFVATPETGHYAVGELRSFVSIYSPLALDRVSVDGAPAALATDREFGRWVYSTFVSVERGQQTRFDLALHGVTTLTANTYSLQLLPQPGPHDETVNAVIRVPDGFRISGAQGCEVVSAHECRRSGPLARPEVVYVTIRRS
jgi:UDP-N-acetylmuramyl pentapeptide phosphotransferase/UDP-N-acetylglucosamine-1-phosphate transferase